VIAAITTGGRETNPPEENPYRSESTIVPAVELTAIQQNAKRAVMLVAGVSMFKGPKRSARKFGVMRPKVEAALSIGRR
jgi:hypothetical protein